ncbi:hypothetical protein PRUPE_3G106600 [Prunus persica]|uniref:Uncharacterized protein n=1 Tax=Prunus persica TaxID=3760 RepID=A0A251PYA7_PRUPE|nr:hypothetical protein PRUPE_3G106600 [Prunus persica]
MVTNLELENLILYFTGRRKKWRKRGREKQKGRGKLERLLNILRLRNLSYCRNAWHGRNGNLRDALVRQGT